MSPLPTTAQSLIDEMDRADRDSADAIAAALTGPPLEELVSSVASAAGGGWEQPAQLYVVGEASRLQRRTATSIPASGDGIAMSPVPLDPGDPFGSVLRLDAPPWAAAAVLTCELWLHDADDLLARTPDPGGARARGDGAVEARATVAVDRRGGCATVVDVRGAGLLADRRVHALARLEAAVAALLQVGTPVVPERPWLGLAGCWARRVSGLPDQSVRDAMHLRPDMLLVSMRTAAFGAAMGGLAGAQQAVYELDTMFGEVLDHDEDTAAAACGIYPRLLAGATWVEVSFVARSIAAASGVQGDDAAAWRLDVPGLLHYLDMAPTDGDADAELERLAVDRRWPAWFRTSVLTLRDAAACATVSDGG